MTTETLDAVEFRCTSCWQVVYAPVDDAGQMTDCHCCKAELEIPQATDRNLCSGDMLARQANTDVQSDVGLTDQEIQKIARTESYLPHAEMEFAGFPNASLTSRFVAYLLDGLFVMLLVALGVVFIIAATRFGFLESSTEMLPDEPSLQLLLVFYFPLLIGLLVQWNLIATRGQTIGKFVCCIRIITTNGKLPGFVKGVILRNWVRNLLLLIPLFGLLDIAFIFTSSKRCIHDYLAGSRVVQV